MESQVTLTENAVKKITELLKKEEKPNSMLRISVEGGGCTGYQYKYDFVTDRQEDDLEISKDGAVVLIDSISLDLIKGSQIDYLDTLAESRFDIKNPNSASRCGCGNSFSI